MLMFFHTPPVWLILGFLCVMGAAGLLVIRGIFIFLAREPTSRLLRNTTIVQLVIFGFSMLHFVLFQIYEDPLNIFLYPGFPFGLLTGIPLFVIAFEGPLFPVVVILTWFLNFAGILAVVHFISNRLRFLR